MKSLAIVLILVTTSLLGIFFTSSPKQSPSPNMPAPTHILEEKKKRKDFKEQRRLWEEKINKSAIGQDWRAINHEQRLEIRNQKKYNTSRQYRSLRGQEFLADDHLIGTWAERGAINVAGRMHQTDVDFDKGTLFSGSDGGVLWKSALAGNKWEALNDHATNPIRFVRLIEKAGGGKRLLKGGDKSFFYSDDDGATWTESTGLDSLKLWGNIHRGIVTNTATPKIYILVLEWDYTAWTSQSKIYRSSDYGLSFQKVSSLMGTPTNKDIWTSRYGTDTNVYLAEERNVSRLGSGGFVSMGTAPTAVFGRTVLTGCEFGGNTWLSLYVDTLVFQSSNAGASWTTKGTVPAGIFARSFASSTKNPQNLVFAGVNCFTSNDGGSTWTLVNNWWEYYGDEENKLHADVFGINMIQDASGNEWVYINCDGGLFRSNNFLATVSNITLDGIGTSQYYSTYTHRTDPDNIYTGSQDQGFQRCLDDSGGVLGFQQTISGDYGSIISGDGGHSLFSVYPGFVLYYPDIRGSLSHQTWDFSSSSWLAGWQWMTSTMTHPTDPSKCYVGGGDSILSGQYLWLIESIAGDLVGTKQSFDFSISGTNEITAIATSPIDPDYRYVLTSAGRFFYSSDAGSTWTLSGFNQPNMFGRAIVPSKEILGLVYISGSGYSNVGVWRSTNHGSSFSPLSTDIPSTNFNDIKLDKTETFLFAATPIGPYVYVMAETKWYYMGGLSAPEQDFRSVDYISSVDLVRFGTYGRGIWDFEIQCVYPQALTLVSTGMDHAVPRWRSVSGAGTYVLRYREEGTASWNDISTSDTFVHVGGLMPGKEYEFQVGVEGCDDFSESVWSNTWMVNVNEMEPLIWRVFPNPSSGKIFIEGLENHEGLVEVIDFGGSVVKRFELGNAYELGGLSGHYILRVSLADGRRMSKTLFIR